MLDKLTTLFYGLHAVDASGMIAGILVTSCLIILAVKAYYGFDSGYRRGFFDGFMKNKGKGVPPEEEKTVVEPVALKKIVKKQASKATLSKTNRVSKSKLTVADKVRLEARPRRSRR